MPNDEIKPERTYLGIVLFLFGCGILGAFLAHMSHVHPH